MPNIQITSDGTWAGTKVVVDGQEVQSLDRVNVWGHAEVPGDDSAPENSYRRDGEPEYMSISYSTREKSEAGQKKTVTYDITNNLNEAPNKIEDFYTTWKMERILRVS